MHEKDGRHEALSAAHQKNPASAGFFFASATGHNRAMLQRLLAGVLGLLFLAATLVFASIAAGVLLAGGLLVWTWAWWRGRGQPRGAVVIEGEFRDETRLERLRDLKRR
jgi:Flp pilus assembly protein TadB